MDNIEMKILIGLHRNVNVIDKKTARLVKEYGLTLSQFGVLEALYSKGDMSIGEVRDKILSSVGTITLIINNLEKMKYIRRLPNEKDRRVCILQLTPAGYDVISELAPKNETLIKESMDMLEDTEKEQLLFLLKKLGGRANAKTS